MTVHGDSAAASIDALMGKIAGGDRSALEKLFRLEAGRLLAVARRIVRRVDLAEEVVQDAFVAIWQRARQYDPTRGGARGWITRIVRNRALNLVRDAARVEHVDGETLESLGDRMNDANMAFERLPEHHALKRCLGRLDKTKRVAILLCYVTGLTQGEVAAKLDAPLGTVKAWIRRGMIALQECLG